MSKIECVSVLWFKADQTSDLGYFVLFSQNPRKQGEILVI
jgi:hypothetical protein